MIATKRLDRLLNKKEFTLVGLVMLGVVAIVFDRVTGADIAVMIVQAAALFAGVFVLLRGSGLLQRRVFWFGALVVLLVARVPLAVDGFERAQQEELLALQVAELTPKDALVMIDPVAWHRFRSLSQRSLVLDVLLGTDYENFLEHRRRVQDMNLAYNGSVQDLAGVLGKYDVDYLLYPAVLNASFVEKRFDLGVSQLYKIRQTNVTKVNQRI